MPSKITPEIVHDALETWYGEPDEWSHKQYMAMEAVLAKVSAALSAQPVVKPLEWRYDEHEKKWCASGINGPYTAYEVYGKFWFETPTRNDFNATKAESLEAAKAAAQADYDARILSALAAPPAPASSEPVDEPAPKFGRLFPTKTAEEVDRDPVYRQVMREMKPLRDATLRDAPPAPTGDGWPVPEPTEAEVEAALITWFKNEISWDKGMAPWTAEQFRAEMTATLKAARAAAAPTPEGGRPTNPQTSSYPEKYDGID